MSAPSSRPLVMGIINVTPDSFSGDGVLIHEDYIDRALKQATEMIAAGADILDIGGESSRPGSTPVPVNEEIRRVIPVVAAIHHKYRTVCLAVDTVKAAVAEEALQAGASMINDISALGDNAMGKTIARRHGTVVLMHNRSHAHAISHSGTIGGQYNAPSYTDVVADVMRDLESHAKTAIAAGIARDKIILDPGIGFGKTAQQNLALITHLDQLQALGFPLLMGVSRKSFIGHVLDTKINERLEGTAACVTACVLRGAQIVRVHDVAFMARVVKMATALRDA